MKWDENDLNNYYFNDNNESIFFDRENSNCEENINLNNFILTNSQINNDFIKDDYYSNSNNNEENIFNNLVNNKIHTNHISEKNENINNNSLNNNNNIDLSTIGNSNQNNNTNSIESNEFFPNDFKNLPLKERMKYKIDKTKKMLEKKTNRNNNDILPLKEETIDNNNKNSKNNNLNINDLDKNNLSKKELKMLRNRLSAQRSRDRKKKEFDELKTLTQNLLTENKNLKNEILQKNSIINKLKNILKNLCPNCLDLIKNNNFIPINTNNNNNNSDESIPIISDNVSTTSNNSTSSGRIGKLSLLTGLIALICIFGTIKLGNNNNIFKIDKVYNNYQRFNPRNLITNFVEKSLNGNEYKQLTYDNNTNNNNSKNKQIQVPFNIQKNYEIRNKKNKEKIKNNNTNLVPINYYNNEIDNNIKNYYKYINKNLPTLFCNNLILDNKLYKAEDFINNLFKNKENEKAISKYNLRFEKHPSISFKGEEEDIFIDLIIPINNSSNEITNNCNSSSENIDYFKVSCKIFEITKNINK